jgi:hypothetical protein
MFLCRVKISARGLYLIFKERLIKALTSVSMIPLPSAVVEGTTHRARKDRSILSLDNFFFF